MENLLTLLTLSNPMLLRHLTLGRFCHIRRGLLVELFLAIAMDYWTGTPCYLTYPAFVLTPAILGLIAPDEARESLDAP